MERPYSPLGNVLDRLAAKRNIRGPYNVGKYVRVKTGGKGPGESAWSEIFRGSHPRPGAIEAFTEAFELSDAEKAELAWIYTFQQSLRRPSAA
jgi:hypothetical protein